MARVLTDEQNYYDIADAIREKLGVETTYLPSEMADAIESIEQQGTYVEKTVTANGTYDPTDDSADAYSSVTVNVQPTLQSKTATENGTVTPDSGYDGLSSVVVNVSSSGGDRFAHRTVTSSYNIAYSYDSSASGALS